MSAPKTHSVSSPSHSSLAAADPFFALSNYAEAGLWWTLALVLAIAAWRSRRWRAQAVMTALVLVCFGGSDVVEAGTGAWWEPWWLLVWKTLCVVALVTSLLVYYFRREPARVRTAARVFGVTCGFTLRSPAALSGLFALALVALAAYSYRDEVVIWRNRDTCYCMLDGLSFYEGAARLSVNRAVRQGDVYSLLPVHSFSPLIVFQSYEDAHLGWHGLNTPENPPGPGYTGWFLGVSLWLLASPFVAFSALMFVRRWRRRHRSAAHLCPACGYDLRGNTSGRCPECGEVYRPPFVGI